MRARSGSAAVAEYAICVATFYEELAGRLVNGATEAFAEHGVSPASVHTFEVPGAFELPLAAKWCAESERFDGCLLYTSPSPRDLSTSRMPSSA